MVEVEITVLAITQRYGSLEAGTVLRTDAAYAEHLVKEANCAKYVKAAVSVPGAAQTSAQAASPAAAPRRRRAAATEASDAAAETAAPAAESAKSGASAPTAELEQKDEGSSEQPSADS